VTATSKRPAYTIGTTARAGVGSLAAQLRQPAKQRAHAGDLVDLPLPAGPAAAAVELADALELGDAAEVLRVLARGAERLAEQLADRVQRAVRGGQARVDAVACGAEDALLEHLCRGVGLVALAERRVAREAVRERHQRGRVHDRRLRVERANLDRAEAGVGAQLPPEPRVVGHVGRAHEHARGCDEVLEVAHRPSVASP
jgi:hypothetical protein